MGPPESAVGIGGSATLGGALPGGEIGVLQRKVGQRGRDPGGRGGIQNAELPKEDAVRPAVERHVRNADLQRPLVVPQAEQQRPEELAGGEI